jgi:hypothetical protein
MNPLKISNMENQRLVASAAVFRGLYSESLDQYDVLSKFISASITLNNLHTFSISECTQCLKNDFGFEVPDAVVRRCVRKKMSAELAHAPPPHHALWHRTSAFKTDPGLQKRFEDAQADNSVLTAKLVEHAEILRKETLSEQEKASLVDDFFSHLKGGARQNENFPLIGHFLLSLQTEFVAQQRLEFVRQGLIIVDGLRYSAEISSEKLPQDLNIYLDTEILFSAVGYHGSLRQQLFNDFHNLVAEVNRKAEKSSSGKIRLRYFDATAREVDNYFEAARQLVDKSERPEPSKQAMTSIVNGCSSGAHVLGKQALFNQQLGRLKITREETTNFYDPPKFNMESAGLIQELERELSADPVKIYQALQQFTRINFLRRGDSKTYLEAVGHIFMSDKNIVRAASFSQAVSRAQGEGVTFATDLDYMTERLWLRLNKGFNSSDSIPISFDLLARTRLVLSAQLGNKVADEYQALQSQQNNARTRMDPETLGYLIADLMNKVRKPEDFTNENLDVAFLASDDFVSTALAEHATLQADAEAGRKAKADLHVVKSQFAEENERSRQQAIAYESEREAGERLRRSQAARYKRREAHLPVFRATIRYAKLIMRLYWFAPLGVMSAILYFMRASADSNLSVFSAYWTVLPVLYGVQVAIRNYVKRAIISGARRYLSSKFRRESPSKFRSRFRALGQAKD